MTTERAIEILGLYDVNFWEDEGTRRIPAEELMDAYEMAMDALRARLRPGPRLMTPAEIIVLPDRATVCVEQLLSREDEERGYFTGTAWGVVCPEYILLFRKLPTDTTKAYADTPVTKTKDEYTRAQWQLDAHGFWRSSGDRYLTKDEVMQMPVSRLQAIYRKYSRDTVYSYEEHVEMAKKLEKDGKLPATFMVVAPGSWTDQVWDDINRMRTYNMNQKLKKREMHVCPGE